MKKMNGRRQRRGLAKRVILLILVAWFSFGSLGSMSEAATLHKEIYWDWMFQIVMHDGTAVNNAATRLWMDGRNVFCVQAERVNYDGDYYPDPIPASQVYDDAILNRLGLITWFGFEQSDQSNATVAFTKMFVYEALGYRIVSLSDSSGAGIFTVANYEQYKANVEAKIAAYETRPSFHGTTLTVVPGATQTFADHHGVLASYAVVNAPSGVTATIDAGALVVAAAADAQDGAIVLRRAALTQGTSLLYERPGRQSVIDSKIDVPLEASVSVELDHLGGFSLHKEDAQGRPLDGAEFSLTSPDGASETIHVTADGYARDGLVAGLYALRETKAPDGYRLDDAVRQIEIKAGVASAQNVQRIVNEAKRGDVEVIKRSQSGHPVEGARFELARDCDFKDIVATGETNAAGILRFANVSLVAGESFCLRETYVPDPYELDPTVKTITVRDNEVTEVTFTNDYQASELEVQKTDMTGQPIAGVHFRISAHENFAEAQTVVTGRDGIARFGGKGAAQTVYVQEVSVPAPYLLDTTVFTATLQAGKTTRLTLQNDMARGKLILVKHDADEDAKPLASAIYRFTHEDGSSLERSTDANGTISVNNLELGDYEIQEISAPAGYVIDPTVHRVSLAYADANTAEIVVQTNLTNRQIRGRIRIVKTETWSGDPVQGAVFQIFNADGLAVAVLTTDAHGEAVSELLPYGHYTVREVAAPDAYYETAFSREVELVDDAATLTVEVQNERIALSLKVRKFDLIDERPLSGAVFQVLDRDGDPIAINPSDALDPYHLHTDVDGEAYSEVSLGIGTYTLVEVIPPRGYTSGTPLVFEITRETEHVLLETGGRLFEAIVGNEPTDIEIVKLNRDGQRLQGALLSLSDAAGETIAIWYSSDLPFRLTRLLVGETYTLSEIVAPAGYAVATPLDITIQDTSDVQHIQFIDDRTEMVIDKRDQETGEPLPGLTFEILRDGEPLSFIEIEDGLFRPSSQGRPYVVSGSTGLATMEGLYAGLYEIREIKSPGYLLDAVPRTVELRQTHGPDDPLRSLWFNTAHQTRIQKVDQDDQRPLAGAEFWLKAATGDPLRFRFADGVYWPDPEGEVTLRGDETGMVTVMRLLPGDYELVETKAPAGYFKGENMRFTVGDAETAHLLLTVKNEALSLPSTGESDTWSLVGALLALNGAGLASIKLLIGKGGLWTLRKKRQRSKR